MLKVKILYQDADLVIVDKPAGFQVHTSEGAQVNGEILYKNNVMRILRDQLGQWVYPVHRLDRATSGVLVFALSSAVASQLQKQFQTGAVTKSYITVVRGHLLNPISVDYALDERPAQTHLEPLAIVTLPIAIGRYEEARYTILLARPITGRFHQIRRHLKHLSHPILGDTIYGDGKHNRYWREKTGNSMLYLKAYSISLKQPMTGEEIFVRSNFQRKWHRLFDEMNVCPWVQPHYR